MVADMLGQGKEAEEAAPPVSEAVKPALLNTGNTASGKTVNTAKPVLREKTPFALRPDVKRHLTELKLDLRSTGYRLSEAEIVEALVRSATAEDLLELIRPKAPGINTG